MTALQLRPLDTHDTAWEPTSVKVALNVRLDARIVPSPASPDGARLDHAHVVVLDDFLSEPERAALLGFLTHPEWDHTRGPPQEKWEQATADGAGLPRSWGLKDSMLRALAAGQPQHAMREVHSRLAKLYPEVDIAHMPSDVIQHKGASPHSDMDEAGQQGVMNTDATPGSDGPPSAQPSQRADLPPAQPAGQEDKPASGAQPSPGAGASLYDQEAAIIADSDADSEILPLSQMPPPRLRRQSDDASAGDAESDDNNVAMDSLQSHNVDCNQFVGNAAMYGDCYQWHVDADPAAFPPSPWVDAFGDYCNGEPGKPLFVSLMLYLDAEWPRHWDAETLFLDSPNDVGVAVRPKPYRAVLMDQDVLHRVSTPSQLAGGRPRYSLVWKLVFLPRSAQQTACIARSEWGPPSNIGSAAHMENVKRSLARKRKAGE